MKIKYLKKILSFTLLCTVGISTFMLSSTEAVAATQKDIIIVLDPGHDSKHHGCHVEPLHEEDLNFTIACYCLQELNKYQGVKVYMTRSSLGCAYAPNEESSANCLKGRVDFATNVHANAFVSIHNDFNPDNNPNVCGTKVIYQNPNYRKDLCLMSYNLASCVLCELQKTGLTIDNWDMDPNGTGLVTRTSADNTYPDGSLMDYYAVLNKTKTAGIPGILIEHAYMSSPHDVANHLSTPAQLKALGVADATAIAKYFNLKPLSAK